MCVYEVYGPCSCPHGRCFTALAQCFTISAWVTSLMCITSCYWMYVRPIPEEGEPELPKAAFGYISRAQAGLEPANYRTCVYYDREEKQDYFDGMWRAGKAMSMIATIIGFGVMCVILCTCCVAYELRTFDSLFWVCIMCFVAQALTFLSWGSNLCDEYECTWSSGTGMNITASMLWVWAANMIKSFPEALPPRGRGRRKAPVYEDEADDDFYTEDSPYHRRGDADYDDDEYDESSEFIDIQNDENRGYSDDKDYDDDGYEKQHDRHRTGYPTDDDDNRAYDDDTYNDNRTYDDDGYAPNNNRRARGFDQDDDTYDENGTYNDSYAPNNTKRDRGYNQDDDYTYDDKNGGGYDYGDQQGGDWADQQDDDDDRNSFEPNENWRNKNDDQDNFDQPNEDGNYFHHSKEDLEASQSSLSQEERRFVGDPDAGDYYEDEYSQGYTDEKGRPKK